MLGGVETGLRHLAGTERMLAQRWQARARSRPVIVLGRPRAANPSEAPRMGHPRTMGLAVAEALDTLRGRFGDRFAFEAESGGGRITLWLAVERPDLLERMVLVSVASETPTGMAGALGRWLRFAEAGRWADFFADAAVALRPAGDSSARALGGRGPMVSTPATPERFIAELRTTIDPTSFVTHRLGEITAPTLVLAGGRDAVVPLEATRAVARGIRDARLEVDPECGHAVRTSFSGYDRLVEDFLTS